jgi:hypothetical protein
MLQKLLIFPLTIVILFSIGTPIKAAAVIAGKITDIENKPLPYVNCFLQNVPYGAMSDSSGCFTFNVPESGSFTFMVMSMGYKTHTRHVAIAEDDSLYLAVTLEIEIMTSNVVNISDSRMPDGAKNSTSLSQLSIFLTPGGAGDIYQTLKAHAGINHVSESAELYVRGGDPSETTTLMDQGILSHPYSYESPHGSLFSNINTVLIKNAEFSPGGFSVKYGNALSGILLLETEDNPAMRELTLGLSLSGLSCNGSFPLNPSKTGLRFAARTTMTDAISTFNRHDDSFVIAPHSYDFNTGFCHRYTTTGKIKTTVMHSSDKQAVSVQLPQYNGIFSGNSDNSLVAIQHQDVLKGNTLIQSGVSFNSYNRHWQLGVLDLKQKDKIITIRTDFTTETSGQTRLRYGVEFYQNNMNFTGKVPVYDYDMRPYAVCDNIDAVVYQTRYGCYGESELKWNNYFTILGVRTDYMPENNNHWYDPRLAVGYTFNPDSYLQLNTGLFQQAPPLEANSLQPVKAMHYTLSYHLKPITALTCNLALYHKQYHRLPLLLPNGRYTSDGYGYAYGIDSELKYQRESFQGWITYSYLESKRYWKDYHTLSPSAFAITHSLTMISTMDLSNSWRIGINFKAATGRPYTPIIGAEYDDRYHIYRPQYAPANSERYPPYCRLDLRLLYLNTIFNDLFLVFYLEALNVLNIANTLDYSYTADYSTKTEIKSFFSRRTIVFGLNISF